MQVLAAEELLGHDEGSATLELIAAIEKLALQPTLKRLDELMAKGDLTDDERMELKELNVTIHLAKSRGLQSPPESGSAGGSAGR
jgi:hypothetical protein